MASEHDKSSREQTTAFPAPATPQGAVGPGAAGPLPDRIGPFRIRSVIASGGMGTVYLAMQEQPRRRVAVKVMKKGIASRSALRRFEYEAQILARLRHPNIAQVYEAGTHDLGDSSVPYFAMEYIPNAKTITEYAQAAKLGTRERLRCFNMVCEAVQHGHQKGIIHRDLKPGNILVDSAGLPRVIDFGVARATDSDLAVTTVQTDVGQLVGTLQYMSPEQCDADPTDLDIRSDVYSLGVVLYELLAGTLPYSVSDRSVYEATRVVKEQSPARLSTANAALRGDVETIVSKALEKDRHRRYGSAGELHRDIAAYLRGEVISARPPSIAYQMRVFARRHRGVATAVVAGLVTLCAGTVGTTVGMLRARANLVRAREAEMQAQVESARATTISEFLKTTLASANPLLPRRSSRAARIGGGSAVYAGTAGEDITVVDMLVQIMGKLDNAFPESPVVEAELRHTLGETFLSLGELREAESQLKRAIDLRSAALGPDHADVARSTALLARTLDRQGRGPDADRLYADAATALARALGETDAEALEVASQRANALLQRGEVDRAVQLQRHIFDAAAAGRGADDPATLEQMVHLCETLWIASEIDQAIALGQEAVVRIRQVAGVDAQAAADAMYTLSGPLRNAGRLQEAETMAIEALQITRANLGNEHPLTLDRTRHMANILTESGQYQRAHSLYRTTLAAQRRLLPPTHIELLLTLNDYAASLAMEGDTLVEAEPLAREAWSGFEGVLGPHTQYTLNAGDTLALILRGLARTEEAVLLHQQILDGSETHGLQASLGIDAHIGLGECFTDLGRFDQAETHLTRSLEMIEAQGSREQLRTDRAIAGLVALYEAWGKPELAVHWAEKLR